MVAGFSRACLSGRGKDSKDPAGTWAALMDAGKAAMEKRQYAEAEKDFRDAVSTAERIGEKDARLAGALLFLAQACDAESKRDEAEILAKRAGEALEKAFKAVKPKEPDKQYIQGDA